MHLSCSLSSILRYLKTPLCIAISVSSLFLTVLAPPSSCASGHLQAEALMAQGAEAFKKGGFEKAVLDYGRAAELYSRGKDPQKACACLIRKAQAYQSIGLYKKSLEILEIALELAEKTEGCTQTAWIMGSMGNACLHTQDMARAEAFLGKGLEEAKKAKDHKVLASIFNNLGNMHAYKKMHAEALECYEKALDSARKANAQDMLAHILTNMGAVYIKEGAYGYAAEALGSALKGYRSLEDSHPKASGLINIAQSYRSIQQAGDPNLQVQAYKTLGEAVAIAETLDDHRAATYALGFMGQMHEQEKDYEAALQYTRRAVFAAQQADSREALYLWQWQTGRIFRALGDNMQAIYAYRDSVQTLQHIRHEINTACEIQNTSSFQESVKPVYFDLADLLIQQAASIEDLKGAEPLLMEARETIELLKKAELSDYLQDPCLVEYRSKARSLDTISVDTAILYIIPFPSRVELLLSHGGGIQRFSSEVDLNTLTEQVRLFRKTLEKRTTREYLEYSKRLYDLLIGPVETALLSNGIKVLVFVPDGMLRNIPMCALNDGREFLVKKLAIVNTPGLDLTDPRPIKRKDMAILLTGLTEPVRGFPPLKHVAFELNGIRDILGGRVLLNADLLISNIKREIEDTSYNIVHIASHGEFRGDVKGSFILAWDGKITMDHLDSFLRGSRFQEDPVELLMLSACQTAAGDDRAALGLAGVAVKAGARSALATLWHIDDRACSELVVDFYKNLQDPAVSKAMALQLAQIKLMQNNQYRHPCYWSPFIFIGNWL